MSRRSAAKPASPAGVLTIGLDIGYGITKAVTTDQVLTFPSVLGHAREIKFQQDEIAQRHPGDQIRDDDGLWFAGDLALSQLPPGELLRLRGRTADEATMGNAFRLRLAKVAIGKLLAGAWNRDVLHLRIATGLPVDHMRDAPDLKAALLGQHLVATDTAEVVANICEVMVMPQPYGTIYAATLTDTGDINRQHTARRTGVCDIGTYTVDLALDDQGEYVDAESGSVESGIYTAQERIAAALERDYRQKIPFRLVEEVLQTGIFHANGRPVNYEAVVQEALAPLRSATLNLMSEKWQRGTTLDVIFLSGGGAALVFEAIRAAYPQTLLMSNAPTANARGYLHYAQFISRPS
ncbi:MAG: ParM/StbA family protein [Chloroflexi bacterium]|nr:ParM/StbA family protein [Chloroflexota bacterium]